MPFRKKIVSTVALEKPPAARDAAFGGPPRYDWMDVETVAAVRIQSIYRRNKVMKQLEREGRTTAAIRNRARRRRARRMNGSTNNNNKNNISGSADVPNIFACCGVGLAFGDATEENFYISRQRERYQYEEEKKQTETKEELLRQQYARTLKTKVNNVEESYEVVE